ncbi:MAG: hypothetical protein RIC87_11425 [Kiloniellales bacterium]
MQTIEPIATALARVNVAYQMADQGEFDYQLFQQFGMSLRGPAWSADDPADLNIVGSERVFGRFIVNHLCLELQDKHGIVARNIGFSGCTPSVIIQNEALMDYLKTSTAIPVIQLCAADGGASDWYLPRSSRRVSLTLEGVRTENKKLIRNILRKHRENVFLYAEKHGMRRRELRDMMRDDVESLPAEIPVGTKARAGHLLFAIQETQTAADCLVQMRKTQAWSLDIYKRIIDVLDREVILLSMFTKDMTTLDENNFIYHALNFPQLVDGAFCESIRGLFSHTIETRELVGERYKKPNEERAFNLQYPTAEMHALSASRIADWYRSRPGAPDNNAK